MANDYYGKIGFRFRPEIERPDPKWAKKLMEEDYSTPYLRRHDEALHHELRNPSALHRA